MNQQSPDPYRPHLVECRKQIEAKQPLKAVEGIEQVLKVKPDHPDANYLMGVALAYLNEKSRAVEHLERSDAARPNTPMVLNELAKGYENMREHDKALAVLDRLSGLDPSDNAKLDILTRRGVVFARQKRDDEAADAFRVVTQKAPGYAPAWHNLGNSLGHMGDREGAVDAFREAARLQPDNAFTLYSFGRALLWVNQYTESVDLLKRAVALKPHELQMISYLILALRHAGREEEANTLEGLDDMIIAVRPPVPQGYTSIDDWNAALREEIVNHPALTTEFENRATRNGAKVDGMFAENKTPVFETFEAQVRAGFDEALAQMPKHDGHPLPLSVPDGYRAQMWSNVMYDGGHQAPHNHPKGWFSACYYNTLPDRVTASGDAHEGWIEFGGTAYDFPEPPHTPKRQVQPEEGLMVVFPSYVFHRTIPFHSDQIRVSCAFDAIPHGWQHS